MTNIPIETIKKLKLSSEVQIFELEKLFENGFAKDKIELHKILTYSQYCGISEKHNVAINKAVIAINQKEELLLLFNLIQQGFLTTDYNFHHFPKIDHLVNNNGDIIYLICLLNICPEIISNYQKKNTPEEIIKNTLLQFRDYNNTNMSYENDRLGISPGSFNWSRLHLNAELFRIGRLEFRIKSIQQPVYLYKNKISNEKTLFINSLQPDSPFNHIDPGGYPQFLDEKEPSYESWKPIFEEDDQSITGNPISRRGFFQKQKMRLLKSEWELIVKQHDSILDMHIPAAGPMEKILCMNSYKKAFTFFGSRYPEENLKCVYCTSWLLSPQLFDIIPNSNTTQLMELYYLFPALCKKNGGLNFIFGKNYDDWSQAPQDTSLQKKIINNILNGKDFRMGSMLLTKDEVETYHTGL